MLNFPFKIGELLEVKIEKLSFGGSGIARKDKVVIFVPFSAPGDLLEIKITLIKKRHAEAQIVRVLQPGPNRALPICPVYEKCGGCNLQHLSYVEQLHQKEIIVKEFIDKAAKNDFTYHTIVPSPYQSKYRNRVQMKYKNGTLGFYAPNTHEIVDASNCIIMEQPLLDAANNLKKSLFEKKSIPIERIELSLLTSGEVSIGLSAAEELTDGFSQVNRFQNINLIQTLSKWIKPFRFDYFYDLYAGSGNFMFAIQAIYSKPHYVGVELHAGAVSRAQNRIKLENVSPQKCEIFCSDTNAYLKRNKIPINSIVLLDPPRSGCHEDVLKSLSSQNFKRLFYISCDPAALSRDLTRLYDFSSGRIRLVQSQCFDMFPQTHHVETLVELAVDSVSTKA
jgi:23S rRNA (uracil1939-C5)-methyltransferase